MHKDCKKIPKIKIEYNSAEQKMLDKIMLKHYYNA